MEQVISSSGHLTSVAWGNRRIDLPTRRLQRDDVARLLTGI